MPENSSVSLHPPIQYSLLWLIIGVSIIGFILLWYVIVYFLSRRKSPTTIESIGAGSAVRDLNGIKMKYLQMIDQSYVKYQAHQITLRQFHKELSITVRYFVYEVTYLPTQKMTLRDFIRLPYPKLTSIIGDYYEKEFSVIEHGDPQTAAATAKELISLWA